MSFILKKGRDTLSDKKLTKLRASLARLQGIHQGLKTQVDAAQSGGRSQGDTTVLDNLKKEKLSVKDEIAAIERDIAALEAKQRAPKLVHTSEAPAGGLLPQELPVARLAASA